MPSIAINTIEELDAIRTDLTADYHLARDLDFNDDGSYSDPAANKAGFTTGAGWDPLVNFGGIFNGAGYSISNLFIYNLDGQAQGFFRGNGNAIQVHNVTLRDVNVTAGDSATVSRGVGSLFSDFSMQYAGQAISNCHIIGGSVTGGTIRAGGFAGGAMTRCSSPAVFEDCTVENLTVGSVSTCGGFFATWYGQATNCHVKNVTLNALGVGTSDGAFGGFTGGVNAGSAILNRCSATGAVNAPTQRYVGGFVGDWSRGSFIECWANAAVVGRQAVGGFGGRVASVGSMSRCFALGDVFVDSDNYPRRNGSFVGELGTGVGTITVEDCYARGATRAQGHPTRATQIGGFLGYNYQRATRRCYSTGNAYGESGVDIGGFAGAVNSDGDYEDVANFWDIEASGNAGSAMGTGLTTVEAQTLATYTAASWDIVAVPNINTRDTAHTWNIVDGESYPFLSWEPISGPTFCLVSASAPSQTSIQAVFCSAFEPNPAIISPGNYETDPELTIIDVTVSTPTEILINTSEQTGVEYALRMHSIAPSSAISAVSTSLNTVQMTFSDAVTDNPALYNPDNYSFSPHLDVVAITKIDDLNVEIETSDQTGESYTLTIYRIGPEL